MIFGFIAFSGGVDLCVGCVVLGELYGFVQIVNEGSVLLGCVCV